MLREDERRRKVIFAPFNPVTGAGSVGERHKYVLGDYPITDQWLPVEMKGEPFVKKLKKAGSMAALVKAVQSGGGAETFGDDEVYEKLVEQFIRIRIKYDFPFWAAMFVYIKRKGGGNDILFRLTRPQRRLVERLEGMRKANKPIRLILLKARQWGGSTCIQLYMAWLQLVHNVGLNSLIIALQVTVSDEIKDMFDRMIKAYPLYLLHEMGEMYQQNEPKMVGVGRGGSIHRVPQRNCKIKIGTVERPNSCRGGDYNLVHLSEVGLWKTTEGKKPEDVVRSATTGVLLEPMTMIVYESTPNGVGNFFHKEYLAAKAGESQMEALFIAWYDIDLYRLPFATEEERKAFASWLWENREKSEVQSDREEPGKYLWWLWERGATLEAIHWYEAERRKFTSHGDMASEYPSDDVEAFTYGGRKVFANDDVEKFRSGCRVPRLVGEVYGKSDKGETALENVRFKKEGDGRLKIWHDVEKDDGDETVLDRYLVVVDVCKGHSKNADFADILVIDRLGMTDGGKPMVAAEWHGHIEMDRLAWKAAQIAEYYNHALLVIESNTLETNNTKGEAEYILTLIHDVYGDQLYARKQSAEDIREHVPKKYGFHTNVLTKTVVVHNLKEVVREQLYIEREAACLDEYITYTMNEDGVFEAMEGYHDDRLMTRAIGMQICFYEMDVPRIVKKSERHSGMSATAASAMAIV